METAVAASNGEPNETESVNGRSTIIKFYFLVVSASLD